MTIVRIEGLNEFHAAVKRADARLGIDMRHGLNEVARVVADAAAPRVPERSGRLARSVKPRSTQREGRVVMGSDAVPYAGFIEFGGRVGRNHSVVRPRVPEGRYLYPAYATRRAEVEVLTEQIITRTAAQAGLY